MWEHDIGTDYAAAIIKQAEQDRAEVPERIRNRPLPLPGLLLYWEAFCELNTCRGGMGDGPIPWTAITAYAERAGITGDQYEALLYIVRELDRTSLAKMKEKAGQGDGNGLGSVRVKDAAPR